MRIISMASRDALLARANRDARGGRSSVIGSVVGVEMARRRRQVRGLDRIAADELDDVEALGRAAAGRNSPGSCRGGGRGRGR